MLQHPDTLPTTPPPLLEAQEFGLQHVKNAVATLTPQTFRGWTEQHAREWRRFWREFSPSSPSLSWQIPELMAQGAVLADRPRQAPPDSAGMQDAVLLQDPMRNVEEAFTVGRREAELWSRRRREEIINQQPAPLRMRGPDELRRGERVFVFPTSEQRALDLEESSFHLGVYVAELLADVGPDEETARVRWYRAPTIDGEWTVWTNEAGDYLEEVFEVTTNRS